MRTTVSFLFILLFCQNSGAAQVTVDLPIPFGEIRNQATPVVRGAIDSALKQNCYGKGTRKAPKPYACGEYPVGTAKDAKTKTLIEVPLKAGKRLMTTQDGKGRVTVEKNFLGGVYLDKKQIASFAETDLLDTKGKTRMYVSPSFTDHLTVRFTPKGADLYALMCGLFPGVQINMKATQFSIIAEYDWWLLFFGGTERARVSTNIADANLKAQSLKFCVTAKTTVSGNTPKFTLIDIAYPQLNDLVVKGPKFHNTKVEFLSFALRLINWIVKIFGIDLEKYVATYIQEQIQAEVNKHIRIHKDQLLNGKMFEMVFEEMFNKKLTRDLAAAYNKLTSGAINTNGLNYVVDGTKYCEQLATNFLKQRGLAVKESTVKALCKKIYAKVSVLPFMASTEHTQRGCFKHAISVFPYEAHRMNKWWEKQCAITTRVNITLDNSLVDALKCLEDLMQKKRTTPKANTAPLQNKCAMYLTEDLLQLPEEVIKELAKFRNISVVELQQLAKDFGVPGKIINQLPVVLKDL